MKLLVCLICLLSGCAIYPQDSYPTNTYLVRASDDSVVALNHYNTDPPGIYHEEKNGN